MGLGLSSQMSGHTSVITTMAYLPGGQRLVTGSLDKTVRIWRVSDRGEEGRPMDHRTGVWCLAVTRDGRKIITGNINGRIKIWDVETHELIAKWENRAERPSLSISSDDQLVAYGFETVVIRELNGGRIIREIRLGPGNLNRLWSLAFSPDTSKLACGLNKDIHIYDLGTPRYVRLVGHGDCVRSLVWSHSGRKLYSSSNDHTIRCWNSETGRPIGEPWRGHTGSIFSHSLSPDGTKLASGSIDRTVRFWDASGRPIGDPLHHSKAVWAVRISPLNDFVASGGNDSDNNFSLWLVPWWNDQLVETVLPQAPSVSADPLSSRIITSTTSTTTTSADPPSARESAHNGGGVPHTHDLPQGLLLTTNSAVNSQTRDSEPQIVGSSPQHSVIQQSFIDRRNSIDDRQDLHGATTVSDRVEAREVQNVESPQVGQMAQTICATLSIPLHEQISFSKSHVADTHASFTITSMAHTVIPPRTESAPSSTTSSRQDRIDLHSFPPPQDLTRDIIKTDDQFCDIGGFGYVYKCMYNSPSGAQEVAVKAFRFVFSLEEGDTKYAKMIRRELGIWKRLEHPNIVPFLGTATGFGLKGSTSIVSLWMPNGSLHTFLGTHSNQLNVAHRLQILLDIAHGLDYLHSFHDIPIVHGDLSGTNVLLDANFTARLADFGYSSFVGMIPEGLTYLEKTTARPGATRWIAPEQIEDTYKMTPKSDIFSFGCIVLQVMSGEIPWSEVREDRLIILLLAKGGTPQRPESPEIDDRHWEFIQSCWSSVEERPSSASVVSTMEQFLSSCPPTRPLCEVFAMASPSRQIDPMHSSSDPEIPPVNGAIGEHQISELSESNQIADNNGSTVVAKASRSPSQMEA